MIELHHLSTGYRTSKNTKVVSKDIKAQIMPGELVSLLGPNGSGKSTLLKTLCGFLPAIAGEVLIDGRNLTTYSKSVLATKVSVVLTERSAVISMTVEEMVAMGRSPYTGFSGRLNSKDKEIVEHSMALMDILELRTRRVGTLSDGERQKVMIAKALAQQTPVILLDEPSAFLDYPSKVELMVKLERLAKNENKVVFLSTHDLNIALELSSRLFLIDKNIGFEFGTSSELAQNGSLQKYFRSDYIRLEGLQFAINRPN